MAACALRRRAASGVMTGGAVAGIFTGVAYEVPIFLAGVLP